MYLALHCRSFELVGYSASSVEFGALGSGVLFVYGIFF